MTVSAALDCDGSCSGNVRVRIGNASSYTDYDLVDSSTIRTDGTTSSYSWYTNTYSISKSTLGNNFFVQLLIYTGSGTIRFLMDESGPTGPDPEFRSGSNGDGSQTGWNNDNGDYFIKIAISDSTAAACLDLSSILREYLYPIPIDPDTGTAGKTNYAIKQTSSQGIISVWACSPELNEEINLQQ